MKGGGAINHYPWAQCLAGMSLMTRKTLGTLQLNRAMADQELLSGTGQPLLVLVDHQLPSIDHHCNPAIQELGSLEQRERNVSVLKECNERGSLAAVQACQIHQLSSVG